jgi:hypothetical protein
MDRLQTIRASTPGTSENYVGADRTAAPVSRQHSIGAVSIATAMAWACES